MDIKQIKENKLRKLITVEQLESFTVIYERKKGNYHNQMVIWK